MGAAPSLCACRYTLFFTELVGSLLLLAVLRLLSFYHVVWDWKEQSLQAPICYKERTLFSVFYLLVASWVLILSFFSPGANR